MFSKLVIALQVAGALLISLGIALIYPPIGISVLGVFAVLFGLALERRNAK